jgi:hypothetical protein
MKSDFYWFKVGLLIGAGFLVTLLVAYWFFPFVDLLAITTAVFLPVLLVVVLVGGFVALCGRFLGRTINRIQGDIRLRQGWADRARR